MTQFPSLNVGYRKTNPTYVHLATSKAALLGDEEYTDEFDLANNLISFHADLPGTFKISIRNPSEELEELLVSRYKLINQDKGWSAETRTSHNIFYLKWGYSPCSESAEGDLEGGSSNIHKVVLYNIKYNLSTAKERVVDILLLSQSQYNERVWDAEDMTLSPELKNLGKQVVKTSIFETKKRIPVTKTTRTIETTEPDPQDFDLPTRSGGTTTVKEVEVPDGDASVGQFRKPSDIISRHLVKLAGHFLGYGVYVSLDEVGTAIDAEFGRMLYETVYAKSIVAVAQTGATPRARNAGQKERTHYNSPFDHLDLHDDAALKFLEDAIANNSSFTRGSDQKLVIPMPGGKEGLKEFKTAGDVNTFWGSIKTIFNVGVNGIDDVVDAPPATEVDIYENHLVPCYARFFTAIGFSFHYEHFDSLDSQIEGLKIANSQTDGKTYIDSENPKPSVNQQALTSFDDDALFMVGEAEDTLRVATQVHPERQLAPHPMHRATRKRLRGRSLLYDETGYWLEHTAVKLSDWTDMRLEAIIDSRVPSIPVVQDKILLEDGSVWTGYRSLLPFNPKVPRGHTEYLSDLGIAEVKAILDGRKAAAVDTNSKAKEEMGTEPETSKPGDFNTKDQSTSNNQGGTVKSSGYIQTDFEMQYLSPLLRNLCGSLWSLAGTTEGVGLRIETEDTGYLETDDDYISYLADRGDFMTVEKLKNLFGVIYIMPKANPLFNTKAIPPLPIRSFDLELSSMDKGVGKTLPIQLSYGFQKRKDSTVKAISLNFNSGQLNYLLHVQPEVLRKAFNLVKLHSSNFSHNIGQITESMLYVLGQNSDTTTNIDEEAIRILDNTHGFVVSEGNIAFSDRAITMIFNSVANYCTDPSKFNQAKNATGGDMSEVYKNHLEFLKDNLGFLSPGLAANSSGIEDTDTAFLKDLYFGPAEFSEKPIDYFIGGTEENKIGTSQITPFKVLVPQTWDINPMTNGGVKAMIAKLAGYRQLRNVLSNIKLTVLGIPEMNRHMSEVDNRIVYLRINNPRDLGTLHWASGYYKINQISHDISTNGGYVTNLTLYVSSFQRQESLANFERAALIGENERIRAAKAGENGGAGR